MSSVVISGNTSGTITLDAPAVAGTTTLTLPATSGTVALTASPTFTGQATIPTINLTGGQITFPATAVPSADANTLDDYEEGTWTPSLGGTATYNGRSARYTKIGNIVNAFCLLNVNLIGTGSTTLISGLPFVSAARSLGSMGFFASLAQNVVFLSPNADGSSVGFEGTTAATTTVTDGIAIFQNNAYVIFSVTYFV
jgi:hypothetical protein